MWWFGVGRMGWWFDLIMFRLWNFAGLGCGGRGWNGDWMAGMVEEVMVVV